MINTKNHASSASVKLPPTTTKPPKIFYVLACMLPIIVLILLEAGLRLVGLGKTIPLFVPSEFSQEYLHVNPAIVNRYFAHESAAPDVRPDVSLFKAHKPKNTFRIFVQGGSTAAGFPYGRNGSLQALLNQQFKRRYPDKNIEVISTAMAAVNSHTLLDLVDEILEQKPDLIVIYAGHNEYVGVMGVGSNFNAFGSGAFAQLSLASRKFYVYQAMERIVYSLFYSQENKTPVAQSTDVSGDTKALSTDTAQSKSSHTPNNSLDKKATLMSHAALNQHIPYASKEYEQGIAQFEKNLSRILARYRDAGVPVVVGNLVSNESDLPPFSALEAFDAGEYIGSLHMHSKEQNILALDVQLASSSPDKHAELFYKLGLNYQAQKQYPQARRFFLDAKNTDTLRFRAPEAFNRVIEEQAAKHDAVFADIEAAFLADTHAGIIGSKHMLEHVHPTARGYFILSDTFAQTIVDKNIIATESVAHSAAALWRDMPLTKLDALEGGYAVKVLKNNFPFTLSPKPLSFPGVNTIEGQSLNAKKNGIGWLDFQNQRINAYLDKQYLAEAAKVSANTSDLMLFDAQRAYIAGGIYLKLKDYTLAKHYFNRATDLDSSNKQYIMALAQSYFFLGKKEISAGLLDRAKRM